MTFYDAPLIDERKEYKDLILKTVSQNQNAAQLRNNKLPPTISKDRSLAKDCKRFHQPSVQNTADLDDDPPF